jgi:hypothetical protein
MQKEPQNHGRSNSDDLEALQYEIGHFAKEWFEKTKPHYIMRDQARLFTAFATQIYQAVLDFRDCARAKEFLNTPPNYTAEDWKNELNRRAKHAKQLRTVLEKQEARERLIHWRLKNPFDWFSDPAVEESESARVRALSSVDPDIQAAVRVCLDIEGIAAENECLYDRHKAAQNKKRDKPERAKLFYAAQSIWEDTLSLAARDDHGQLTSEFKDFFEPLFYIAERHAGVEHIKPDAFRKMLDRFTPGRV